MKTRYVVDKDGIASPLDGAAEALDDGKTVVDLTPERAAAWERFVDEAGEWRAFWTTKAKASTRTTKTSTGASTKASARPQLRLVR
jgi:hypothetical protein